MSLCHNEWLVTLQWQMRLSIVSGLLWTGCLSAQTSDEEFRVYREHPRLFLTAQRLRLLKRERERASPRWQQFELLAKGGAQMPEPGFAAAFYFAVTGDPAFGRRAVDWALGPGADLRQLALVYDWCQPALNATQSTALAGKIHRLMDEKPASPETIFTRRDRVLAVIATADDTQHGEEKYLRDTVERWWQSEWAPALTAGRRTAPFHELYALVEILHAVRDNLKIELEDSAQQYFRELPTYQILGAYPAPLAAPENQYWIPAYKEEGQPDLNRAALARAAGLSLVAYANNALENQYLQGWLMQDAFILRSAFGAPYEFLWANPYQPGLAYTQLPLILHDKNSGTLFVRSSWEDDATWFGLYEGEAQLFQDGHITVLNRAGLASSHPKPIVLGAVSLVPGTSPVQFSLSSGTTLVLSLKPEHPYAVEVDDEEMRELETDPAGTLVLDNPAARTAGVRIHEIASPAE